MKNDSDKPSERLIVRDGIPLLGSRCVDTRSGVRADYEALRWDVRQANQYIIAKAVGGLTPTVSDFERAFRGSLLVGDGRGTRRFTTDRDIENLIKNPTQGPAKLAQELIAKGTGLSLKTVVTYTKKRAKTKRRKRHH